MSFLYPGFLWALLLLAIPIVVHLFNFRRYKKILFPNVRMLQQIQQQTKSGNQLRKYLILACRLLALTMLVLAFAQPFIPKNNRVTTGGKHISILVDNSFSMNLDGEEGPLLEAAKNRARAIINTCSHEDEISIVTADLNAAMLHFSSKQTALDNLDRIRISGNALPLKHLLAMQNNSLSGFKGNASAYCISDFQASNSAITEQVYDSSIHAVWIRIPSGKRDNLSIDTCYLVSPVLQTKQPVTLMCKVSNYTEQAVSGSTLELWIDGKPKGVATFDLEPMSSALRSIVFSVENGGNHSCELRLPGDNIPMDDVLFFALKFNSVYNIGGISKGDGKYTRAVFADNPGFAYTGENSGGINYGNFSRRDLIVLENAGETGSGFTSELLRYTKNGGTLFLFPDKDLAYGGLAGLGAAAGFSLSEKPLNGPMKITRIDYQHPVFRSIFEKTPEKPDLPQASTYYSIRTSGAATLMQLASGEPFISDIRYGKGHMMLCATPLDPAFGNFQNHALFVPMLLRSAMLGAYRFPLYYSCSERADIYTGLPFESESGISLKGSKTAFMTEAINREGELFINTNGQIETPGHYALFSKTTDSARLNLAFNADRSESDTRTLSESALDKLCETYGIERFSGSPQELEAGIGKSTKGTVLWKWCILFSLFCLLIEILLIRFFRNNVSISA